jgi:antagonist of KipI
MKFLILPMHLRIAKAGLFDTIQDQGRYGYRHLGINVNGAMDRHAAAIANALTGQAVGAPVLEMTFPGPELVFEADAILALTGADFSPYIEGVPLPVYRPVRVRAHTRLTFEGPPKGKWCYLGLYNGLNIPAWRGSASTNLPAKHGGWQGCRLVAGDRIPLLQSVPAHAVSNLPFAPFRCYTRPDFGDPFAPDVVAILPGPEWSALPEAAQMALTTQVFRLSRTDRMGCVLVSEALAQPVLKRPMVSAAVDFGTMQLLPNGQITVLMADHQTTGGYPRIGHIIGAHLGKMAQYAQHSTIQFALTDMETAERLYLSQKKQAAFGGILRFYLYE